MSRDTFLDELISTLGADVAQRGSEVPERYWTDWSGTPPERPLALVRPRSTEDVSALMRLCSQHRVSVVLSLEGLELEAQMRCAAAFLAALFDAPRDHWYPALVVVDEAQLFAPAVAGEVSDEARRASLGAMTITGVASSINAMGPCFSSPAA